MNEPTPPSLIKFKPSPKEQAATAWYFEKADTDKLGVLVGEKAVQFFSHSSVAPALLGEIWNQCDPENSGFLTPERFGVACRLIGHIQSSGAEEIKSELIAIAGPLPRFDGFPLPAHLANVTPASLAPQQTGTFANLPAATSLITADEKTRYSRLFNSSGPVMGLLDGDKARDIFMKSNLPVPTLGHIWNLADTRSRGSLDVADFTVGMHMIQGIMSGNLQTLPAVLSPALYASALSLSTNTPPIAARTAVGSPLRPQVTGGYGGARTLSPQTTGNSFSQQQSQFAPQQQFSPQRSTFAPAAPYGQPWDVSVSEKAEADKYFGGLDPTGKGFIEGEMALPFMMASGLPTETLALVWELADIRGQGSLNRDEFAVAMKLIVDKTQFGKEIPSTLPAGMIPPSLRSNSVAQQAPQQDLLSLMDDDVPLAALASTSPPPIYPQATGSSSYSQSRIQPQVTGTSISRGILTPTTSVFPQATGSSGFGLQGTIFPQATGVSVGGITPTATRTASTFFDDNDAVDTSNELNVAKAQLSTLEAEHESVTTATKAVSSNRAELEASLTSTTAALNDIHEKLGLARKSHEEEKVMLESLQARKKEQNTLSDRARHELITAESDLSSLRVDRTELEGNFLRDKEEVRELQRRLTECRSEEIQLKETLEALKKEGRRGKGRLAIEKKQLSSKEADIEGLKAAIELEKATPQDVEEEESPFDLPTATHAATFALPTSPPITTSPTGSTRSTNPFERMTSLSTVLPSTLAPPPSAPKEESTLPSLIAPVAIVATVGAGVLAATTGIVSKVSRSKEEEEGGSEVIKEEPVEENVESIAPVALKEAESPIEKDPFGMTTGPSPVEEEHSFGDDFGSNSFASTSKQTDFDDSAFDELSTPATESIPPPSSNPKPIEEQPRLIEEKEEDSSDDEPEDAIASKVTKGTTGEHKSGSDGSFIHVDTQLDEIEEKFPSLAIQPESTTTHSPPISTPSELDNFEDATPFEDQPEQFSSNRDIREGAPSPPASIIDTATKKRAAPPPPARAIKDEELATAPHDAFEDEFSDMAPAATVTKDLSHTTLEDDNDSNDFDEFENFQYEFQPTSNSAPTPFEQNSTAFDDSFADFDSPTPATLPSPISQPPTATGNHSFDFDDAFGSSTNDGLASSLGKQYAAPPGPPPNLPSRGVEKLNPIDSIVGMGFTKEQAKLALEKYDYDPARAINSLLG